MSKSDPLQNKLVTILGGSGFVGGYVAQALLERGARLRIVSRNPSRAFALKPLANLGQLQIGRCDITNEEEVRAAVDGADAIINMVGSFDGDLTKLMGDAAGVVAKAAADGGSSALVHISAIGADPESAAVYGRANALGEKLVLEAFPKATIIRPSALFGKDDNFINLFAQMIQLAPVLPVFGPDSKLQPAFVDDVALAIAEALANPAKHGGKTYELGGPEQISMMELNMRIADAQHRKRHFLAVPDAISALFAALPLTPINSDQWALLKQGNCTSGDYPGFKELGIKPRPLDAYLDKWMVRYRQHGRFSKSEAGAA
ncbi:MAG TPA: complex I NDUFA9 subunit family protein [Erythrobacter sp.]|nr:complex I NDUFA9 subunit family protein [Erythrobacter sp.]